MNQGNPPQDSLSRPGNAGVNHHPPESKAPLTGNECLVRDCHTIGNLSHKERFENGMGSVIETLLPFHAFSRSCLLDEDYRYGMALIAEEAQKQSNTHDGTPVAITAQQKALRRLLGARNDVWEAHMAKKATRLRRRFAKMIKRIKELENKMYTEGKSDTGLCELVFHASDCSTAKYALAEKQKEIAAAEAEAAAAAKAKEEALRRQQIEQMREREAAAAAAAAVPQPEPHQSLRPSGSIKLKLVSSSAKLPQYNTPSAIPLQPQTSADVSTRPAMSDDIMTEAMTDAAGNVTDSRAFSAEIDVDDDMLADSQYPQSRSRMTSSLEIEDDEDEDDGSKDNSDKQEDNNGNDAEASKPEKGQTGKFKLLAMLQKKK